MKSTNSETVIKVYSGNKKAIVVNSLDDVQSCITKNKLVPESGESFIRVIEEIINEYSFAVKVETLSKENKQLLVNLVINRLVNDCELNGRLDNPMFKWIYRDRYNKEFITSLSKWILEYKGYTEEDIINEIKMYGHEINRDRNPTSCLYRNMFKDLGDHTFIRNLWKNTILDLMKVVDVDTLNVEVNLTNYKPCHNIRLFNDNGIDIQIRASDLVYNEGKTYGRNVNCNRTFKLNDSNLKDYLKKLEISL